MVMFRSRLAFGSVIASSRLAALTSSAQAGRAAGGIARSGRMCRRLRTLPSPLVGLGYVDEHRHAVGMHIWSGHRAAPKAAASSQCRSVGTSACTVELARKLAEVVRDSKHRCTPDQCESMHLEMPEG